MLAVAACLTGLTEKAFFALGYVNQQILGIFARLHNSPVSVVVFVLYNFACYQYMNDDCIKWMNNLNIKHY